MNKRIFTGNYEECKVGNLISISGDRGKVDREDIISKEQDI